MLWTGLSREISWKMHPQDVCLCDKVCHLLFAWCFPFLLDPWGKLLLNKVWRTSTVIVPFLFVYRGRGEAKHYLLILMITSRWSFFLLLLWGFLVCLVLLVCGLLACLFFLINASSRINLKSWMITNIKMYV